MSEKFYVTTPIYYVNDVPHLGTAYTTIAADAFARQRGLRGRMTRFLTGTDEHGLKIDRSATERGMTPKAFVDEVSAKFREAWPKLHCEPDDFIRTTDARHIAAVQRLWTRCVDAGDIYKGDHEGWYCVACEQFYLEKDLVDAKVCPTHKREVEWMKEPTYFFRLSKYQDRLLALYAARPEFVLPEGRRNEVLSFVREGLRDLSVSRTSFAWGVPVPGDPAHVMYVWFDALTNYLSAVEGTENEGFWPPDLQLVGKDILRFHTIYWPAFLMSAGFADEQLPRSVFAHGFLTINGQKMGKSLRNTVEPLRLAERFGADEVRYFLLREIALGQDGDFSHRKLIARTRSELAATVGNLLHRAMPFATKYLDERVPAVDEAHVGERERALRAKCETLAADAGRAWDSFEPHRALECAIQVAIETNGYFDARAPWTIAKDPARLSELGTVIYHVFESLRICSVLLWPALPTKCDALRAQLGLSPLQPAVDQDQWPGAWGQLLAGTAVSPGAPLFRNITREDEQELLKEFVVESVETVAVSKTEAPTEASPQPVTEGLANIAFADFEKVDLRLGQVRSAEKIPKKDKLLKLTVDLGEESGPRTIIAGIAMAYAPEQLVGKQLVVVANLAPRDFGKGLISHGMLLACGPSESLSMVTLEKPMPVGTRVK
ncbi:MAG: methionine--tRNA ligase [Deltaproteobacteria bacterium]|nr:methionine--tRNA ligase [Deltaproteobacteria bacterium]